MQPIWIPDEPTVARSNIYAAQRRLSLGSYNAFYRWSIDDPAAFWGHVIDTLGIRLQQSPSAILNCDAGPTAPRWFPDAKLNIAESCFQAEPETPAIISGGLDGNLATMTYGEVRRQANAVANGLRNLGLQPGDAVAVFMPMTARSVGDSARAMA